MSCNDSTDTFPDGASNFSKTEVSKWNKRLKELQDRLAKTCIHLVVAKGPAGKKPKKKFVSRKSKEYQEYLDDTLAAPEEDGGADDIIVTEE